MKRYKYEEIRPDIKTGDILLFSGKGNLSELIKKSTFSKWSHVAMALRLDEYNIVLCYESTTLSNIADVTDGKKKKGIQLVSLAERLANYKGDVGIRHLHVERTPEMMNALKEYRKEVKNRKYEVNLIELAKSALDLPPRFIFENDEDLSSLFCSEHIAEAYQRMKLLSEEKASNEYTPADFSVKLELLKGYLEEIKYFVHFPL